MSMTEPIVRYPCDCPEVGHFETCPLARQRASGPTFTIIRKRRTPALTKQAREMFETVIRSEGWTPGLTIERIAAELSLSPEQVRDAIFAPSADVWRAELTARINASRYSP